MDCKARSESKQKCKDKMSEKGLDYLKMEDKMYHHETYLIYSGNHCQQICISRCSYAFNHPSSRCCRISVTKCDGG